MIVISPFFSFRHGVALLLLLLFLCKPAFPFFRISVVLAVNCIALFAMSISVRLSTLRLPCDVIIFMQKATGLDEGGK
jgi:hypothetical protein